MLRTSRLFSLGSIPNAAWANNAVGVPFVNATRFHSSPTARYEVENEDLLDISSFGNYNLVLPENPYQEGVSPVAPATVPEHIPRPSYVTSGTPYVLSQDERNMPYFERKFGGIRLSGSIASLCLQLAGLIIKPGITTRRINDLIHETIIGHGAYPSTLLYKGYPMSCCTSVNNVIAHGIPDNRPLEDGDIVNVDVTVFKNGWHGDTSKTFLVGTVDDQGRELVQTAEESLQAAISICGPGVPFSEIGRVIERLAQTRGLSVSSQLSGHGIGEEFHLPPWISHVAGETRTGFMEIGDCFTIEPAIVQGEDPSGWLLPDGWTFLTESGARSAQTEHTIGITSNGAEILTA